LRGCSRISAAAGQHPDRLVSRQSSAVRPGWLLTSDGASGGRSGVASGSAASCSSASTLSSAAVLFSRRRPQWVHRWINTQRRSPRTVTAIGSIPPGQPDFRSPGTLRSRCLDHRQRGQWLRWVVPARRAKRLRRNVHNETNGEKARLVTFQSGMCGPERHLSPPLLRGYEVVPNQNGAGTVNRNSPGSRIRSQSHGSGPGTPTPRALQNT
jgi:hypothetical protein